MLIIIDQPVAIKTISLTAAHTSEAITIMESFMNEIKMIKRLPDRSSHIIHMYDFDFQRPTGLCYIVMELGQQDLEKHLSQRTALSPMERKTIWRQLVNIARTLHNYQMVR
jgi:serine/threonine protein kinase